MSETVKKEAVYDDLLEIPENMIGEIIARELIVSPRPSPSRWSLLSTHADDDQVRAEPFSEIEIPLSELWWQ